MSESPDQGKNQRQYAINMTLASVAGQVGCLTLIIIFAALFAGLGLDKLLNTKPVFTLILLIGSVPLTLILMFRIVKAATDRMRPKATPDSAVEETHHGTSS
ncbi:MAG: AtpZ/AtpI family protein [Anaerolineales bacterium]|jgi:F0F1-type ATP synthase assembly protein I